MFTIQFKDGGWKLWRDDEYSGYSYEDFLFIVYDGDFVVAIYNMDEIKYIEWGR